jgi:succinate dehydrogenase / fumarate reductase iron-sulfur subunit
MKLKLKVWRQQNGKSEGAFQNYDVDDISPDMSFLEMFDVLNERLINEGDDPIAFDHDCREGICGMCSMYINGKYMDSIEGVTTCQLHMRSFHDGESIVVALESFFISGCERPCSG